MNKYSVFGVFSILFAAVPSLSIPTPLIKGTDKSISEFVQHFQKIGENYYLVESTIQRTWQDAVHYCRTQGAHLTSIESESEWKALNSYLMSQGYTDEHRTWIGANDIDTAFKFFWISSGEPMQYTKWSPNEPNNEQNNERCVHLWFKNNKFEMNDWYCKSKAHYICKF